MKNLFEDNLIDWIESNGLFCGNDRVLLAVSGGADSVAMAHALVNLQKRGRLSCGFVIGHVNHCLRGAESDADEAFVRTLADLLGVPVVTKAVDVTGYAKKHKLSIETAGRNLRLKTLAAMAEDHGCRRIATAHHQDDQAETLIHRLMRGTGFRGLCGIRPVSQVYGVTFIRPMLNVRRNAIIQYCKNNDLNWREDASNTNVDFTRNRIRHSLLPHLNNSLAVHPTEDIVALLAELSCKSRRLLSQTETQANLILNRGSFDEARDKFTIKQDVLEGCPPWVFYEVVRKVLVKLNTGLRNYTQEHFKKIHALLNQDQADVSMPGPIQVYVKKGIVGFSREVTSVSFPSEPATLEIGQTREFGLWRISCQLLEREDVDLETFLKTKDSFVEWFDADKVSGPLIVRLRTDGDRFRPIGGKGEKKVGRFLQDAQLAAEARKAAFIIADREKILWLAPIRMSEPAKVTGQTKSVLEITVFGTA